MSDDNETSVNKTMDLHSLLTPQTIEDWGTIRRHIERHPHHARERYYRHESPLQLALTARGDRKERMDVLRSLVDADPASIHSRDEEGRTPLHSACAAGRSDKILRWLINAEDETLTRRLSNSNEIDQHSVTLRTDYPGGALPLHLISACSTFDCSTPTSLERGEATEHHHRSSLPLNRYRVHCAITPDIISAYLSTTCIWKAHPEAVWDRDCEGEIPLHAAASWGNVGAILSLLIGAAARENNCPGIASSAAKRAALTTDDRNKTPLDLACNRLSSICVNRRDRRPRALLDYSSFRQSIPRDDPFDGAGATPIGISFNEGRRSLLRSSQMMGSCRRRIPGCGSSFRSSLFSSLVGEPSADLALHLNGEEEFSRISSIPITSQRLNSSFISLRKPIDPMLGLEVLDGDGDEELAKVEMLAIAASGFFQVYSETTPTSSSPLPPADTTTSTSKTVSCFRLLHAVIALGCAPEIVWHAAAVYPHQVEEKDELGRCPLFLACDKLAACTRLLADRHRRILDAEETKEYTENIDVTVNEDADSGTKFVRSLLLGEEYPSVLDDAISAATALPTTPRPTLPHGRTLPARSPLAEIGNGSLSSSTRDDDLRECASSSREVIYILLRSSSFGRPEMAAVPDAEGRLPLHVVLEAGMQWAGEDDGVGDSLVPQSLMDVYPRALEIKDGKTRLLPFMIAATRKSLDVSNVSEDEGCTTQLQTIYQLLLKAPNAIALSM